MQGFWKSWLNVWCWAVFGFGLLLAGAAIPGADIGVRMFYDLVYWPLDGQSGFGPDTVFTAALLGAVTMGWALTIMALVSAAEHAGAQAWRGLTLAVLTWYVIDSIISVALGVAVNAVSNTVIVAAFLAPILGSGVLGGAKPRLA